MELDWRAISDELRKPLDSKHVRPPAPGKYGDYIEGWHAIAEANRIFGEGGWSANVHGMTRTNASEDGGKHRVGYMAFCTVTVGGVSRTDVGHGQGFGKSEGDAHDSAVKEAATDAIKRALRTFGNPFGLALYDKTKANVADVGAVEAAQKRADAIIAKMRTCTTLEELQGLYGALWKEERAIAMRQDVEAAKDDMKKALKGDDAARMAAAG